MGQEESRVYAGVGKSREDAAQNLEYLLRFYVASDYRVVWVRLIKDPRHGGHRYKELRVLRPDGTFVLVTCKQDIDTGLHSCEVVL